MRSIAFVLPVGGGSGGAHSVMQEADAMIRLGVRVTIFVNSANSNRLRVNYNDLRTVQNVIVPYDSTEDLGLKLSSNSLDWVIATTNQSVHVLHSALQSVNALTKIRTAYYVQDYEPLFYARGSDDWLLAYKSYGLIPGCVHFAKTRWLQEVVEANHGVQVYKVSASIDHDIYFPCITDRFDQPRSVGIAAMLRPATPRRAPRRTVRLMNRIAHDYGDKVTCVTFGCSSDELQDRSLKLSGVEHLGTLRRGEVGNLFRGSSLFLDLSDYQAFGRTAIEAMSCGAVAVVPAHGGAYEFARHGVNSFIVDVRSDENVLSAVSQYLACSNEERRAMSLRAIEAGFQFSPEGAALSEILLLSAM